MRVNILFLFKGDRGEDGPKGDKGDQGNTVSIKETCYAVRCSSSMPRIIHPCMKSNLEFIK